MLLLLCACAPENSREVLDKLEPQGSLSCKEESEFDWLLRQFDRDRAWAEREIAAHAPHFQSDSARRSHRGWSIADDPGLLHADFPERLLDALKQTPSHSVIIREIKKVDDIRIAALDAADLLRFANYFRLLGHLLTRFHRNHYRLYTVEVYARRDGMPLFDSPEGNSKGFHVDDEPRASNRTYYFPEGADDGEEVWGMEILKPAGSHETRNVGMLRSYPPDLEVYSAPLDRTVYFTGDRINKGSGTVGTVHRTPPIHWKGWRLSLIGGYRVESY